MILSSFKLRQKSNIINGRLYYSKFTGEPSTELKEMMHGRKGKERKDSVTLEILNERYIFRERIRTQIVDSKTIDEKLLEYLDDHGLGSKRKRPLVYTKLPVTLTHHNDKKTLTGAGGYITHISSCSSNWPLFEHLLPEIAFAGHSNSGKSTLINALSGLVPRTGPASVSDRAGWTDQICFYRVGKRPPVLTLVDFPGYGHAVATARDRRGWTEMIRDYVSDRDVLSTCCVLVDCTRGLCALDKNFLWLLLKQEIPYLIVLTKADLLPVDELASSILLVAEDLSTLVAEFLEANPSMSRTYGRGGGSVSGPIPVPGCQAIIPVSSSTGAGIQALWRAVRSQAASVCRDRVASTASGELSPTRPELHHAKPAGSSDEQPPDSAAVKEHYLADRMRRSYALHGSRHPGGPGGGSSSASSSPSPSRNNANDLPRNQL